jgi:hypothetical protein
MERRETAEPEPAAEAEPQPEQVDPLAEVNLAELADQQLYQLWRNHPHELDLVARVTAELNHRDRTRAATDTGWPGSDQEQWPTGDDEETTEQQRRIDELLTRGWDYREAYAEVHGLDEAELERQERAAAVDVDRRTGETRPPCSITSTEMTMGSPSNCPSITMSTSRSVPRFASRSIFDSVTVTPGCAKCCRTRRTIAWNGVVRLGIRGA